MARFGTRIVITLALLLLGGTLILTGLAQTFTALTMRFLTGVCNAASLYPGHGPRPRLVCHEARGFATGIVSGGIGAGTLISGLLVPPIVSAYGLKGGVMPGTLWEQSLVIALVVYALIRSRPDEKGLRPIGALEKEAPPPAPSGAKVSSLQWSAVYKVGNVWYLGLVYFFYGFSYIIYMTFFAAYLEKEMGFTKAYAGGLWALVGGLSIFCGILWGGISDRLGRSAVRHWLISFLGCRTLLTPSSGLSSDSIFPRSCSASPLGASRRSWRLPLGILWGRALPRPG
jgi:nitrate/nitrite transporter NarK